MKDNDWSAALDDHPIFSLPTSAYGVADHPETSLELSMNTLQNYRTVDPREDGPTPSGRRQIMILKNEDLIVAAGHELRITSLGDSKMGRSSKKSYKVLHTPNVQFEIHQLALNPSAKLLAVAGAFQVAVVVLPRPGYSRLVSTVVDCKSIQVGQFYHASEMSAAIAKIEWHPWGEAGSTLMVMTVDGKLREYDISIDTEEPQQVLSFVPERKAKSYLAEDTSEREVASFTLGRGKADWGPLTVYTVMKSGDIYAICPYMPRNASVPSSYISGLQSFTNFKMERLAEQDRLPSQAFSTHYNNQSLYIKALFNQLPHDLVLGTSSRSVLMHPPTTVSYHVARQGPFLLQPAPRTLDGVECSDAADIVYLVFGADDDDEGEGETDRLGIVLVAYQDGRVDVCLDVDKVEARWDTKSDWNYELPMLAVYETIDLGLVSSLSRMSDLATDSSSMTLLQGNHPVFHTDPIHDDTVYVYHAFGVHALYLGPMLQAFTAALRTAMRDTEDNDTDGTELIGALLKCGGTSVQPILTTFSVERKCSNPVVAVAVPNDVYLAYGIFVLTSAWRICSFPLNLRSDSPISRPQDLLVISNGNDRFLTPLEGPPPYISLLSNEPFTPASILSRSSGLPSNPRLAIGSPTSQQEFVLTPDSLRYFATTVQHLTNQIHEILIAGRAAEARADLQKKEFLQQQTECRKMTELIADLKGRRAMEVTSRAEKVRNAQKKLAARSDRILQALVDKASPGLSEHETKWFDELKRMKEDINGAGRYDEGSLSARAKLLQREYDRLLPSLKELLKQETEHRKRFAENIQGFGVSQAFELGERSNSERERILAVEKDISDLASRLELSLARPPSHKAHDSSG